MKKLFIITAISLGCLACSEDLSMYYDRLDEREAANKELEEVNARQEAANAEQEAWDAEQKRRNDEQAQQNEGLSHENDALSGEVDALEGQIGNLEDQKGDQEQQNEDLSRQNDEQEERNEQLRLMWEELQAKLDSLEALIAATEYPHLLTMEFVTTDNRKLNSNVKCEIIGDSIIECWLPDVVTDKNLIPRFTYEGTMIVIDGYEAESGKTKIDFSRPRTVTVATYEKKCYYTIYVHSYTGLPRLYLRTDGGRAINSKDVYVPGSFTLIEDARTRAAGDVIEGTMNIKGRGNSTWHRPKKPYRIKLNEKMPLLDMHKDKHWVLIANYPDKTMLRNHLANYMGRLSNLDYTPESHFVEMFMNGMHQGTYQLCEKIRVSNHRVAVGDDGFLLEIDSRATSDSVSCYFSVKHIEEVIDIKAPDVAYNDENYNYVRNFVSQADEALFSNNFTDPNAGWRKYLDEDSFVDWYIINEISKNLDSFFWSSCYMNMTRDGKLKMGPLWDYDVAFGNIAQSGQTCYAPSGFYIKNIMWYARLFKDPIFVAKVKERFNYFYSYKNDMLANINADAQYLKYSVEENEKKWNLLYEYTWSNYNIWGSYQNEVQSLKVWLNERMEWLKIQFDNM